MAATLEKLRNSCEETIKDGDRQSKEMFKIYHKRGRDADACFAVGIASAESMMYTRISKLVLFSQISINVLRCVLLVQVTCSKFPKEVKNIKSDTDRIMKNQVGDFELGTENLHEYMGKVGRDRFKKISS